MKGPSELLTTLIMIVVLFVGLMAMFSRLDGPVRPLRPQAGTDDVHQAAASTVHFHLDPKMR